MRKESILYIYKITNKANGRVYVGATEDCETREYTHFSLLKSGKHHNTPLQSDFNSYRESNFEFHVVSSHAIKDKHSKGNFEEDAIQNEINPYNTSLFCKSPIVRIAKIKGISITALSKKAGYTHINSFYRAIKCPDTMAIGKLFKIADVLGMTICELTEILK